MLLNVFLFSGNWYIYLCSLYQNDRNRARKFDRCPLEWKQQQLVGKLLEYINSVVNQSITYYTLSYFAFQDLLHNLACKRVVAYLLIRELPISTPLQAKMYLGKLSNLKDLWAKNGVKTHSICLKREFCMMELPFK
ncbi:Hypothetical_protein [Hexamita inflata]|uniref:Hypothetical_protein n=1 Tax=Hexamita inflata TaxID=28002 RepID=A0AA86NQ02_9EUKA|nr:Hypothetical protein HINF_LOCUS11338 [Hexamita inflata]